MGFPFDRQGRSAVRALRSFLTPNMFIQDVTITFQDQLEAPAGSTTTLEQGQQQQAARPSSGGWQKGQGQGQSSNNRKGSAPTGAQIQFPGGRPSG